MSQRKRTLIDKQCQPIANGFTVMNHQAGRPYTTSEIFNGVSRRHREEQEEAHRNRMTATATTPA